ncbi:hypothetical protein ACAF76_008280 [Brevibacillus sp. TJ4]|uniref:hypothetical protein n=1 Tax=Brevibacillus sp. TJ4 TaxID=3234853 RepID=UPI0037D8CDBD
MTAVKPKPDHPWRRSCIINKQLNDSIKKSVTNPWVNSFKVGGGRPAWNGKK